MDAQPVGRWAIFPQIVAMVVATVGSSLITGSMILFLVYGRISEQGRQLSHVLSKMETADQIYSGAVSQVRINAAAIERLNELDGRLGRVEGALVAKGILSSTSFSPQPGPGQVSPSAVPLGIGDDEGHLSGGPLPQLGP